MYPFTTYTVVVCTVAQDSGVYGFLSVFYNQSTVFITQAVLLQADHGGVAVTLV